MAKVLIVEDDPMWHAIYRQGLDRFEMLSAMSVREARDLFLLHEEDIVLIVLDGNMGLADEERTTLQFARDVHKMGFQGAMVASSGDPGLCNQLMTAGCTHQVSKDQVFDLVEDLFESKKVA